MALTAAWAFAFQSIYVRDEPRIAASRWIFQNVPGPVNVQIQAADGKIYNQPLPFATGTTFDANTPYSLVFTPAQDGRITGFTCPYVTDVTSASNPDLSLLLSEQANPTPDLVLAQAFATVNNKSNADLRGSPVVVLFDKPVPAVKGIPLWLNIQTSNGFLTFNGSAVTNETDYDYGLPSGLEGYDAFGGIYRGDLNLQVYWDDNVRQAQSFCLNS